MCKAFSFTCARLSTAVCLLGTCKPLHECTLDDITVWCLVPYVRSDCISGITITTLTPTPTTRMEKETLNEKGDGLPVPAGLQKAEDSAARSASQSSRRSKRFRLVAGAALAVFIGGHAFSALHRSLERERFANSTGSLNPDSRGKLTVQEAESHFL